MSYTGPVQIDNATEGENNYSYKCTVANTAFNNYSGAVNINITDFTPGNVKVYIGSTEVFNGYCDNQWSLCNISLTADLVQSAKTNGMKVLMQNSGNITITVQ